MAELLFFSEWWAIRAKRDRNEKGKGNDTYKAKNAREGAVDGEKFEEKVGGSDREGTRRDRIRKTHSHGFKSA